MNCTYDDILALFDGAPKWWDEYAVPRFCDFAPDKVANIYADEVALAEVTCQGCHRPFPVAFSRHIGYGGARFAEAIPAREMHYGDPPNVGCCGVGATMNSEPRRVLEYWSRNFADPRAFMKWHRDPSLEISIVPDWVEA